MSQETSRRGSRGLQVVLLVVYLVLLAWLVLWKFEAPWVGAGALRGITIVPFQPGANTFREILANVVFFVPFGLYLALLWPCRRWWQQTAWVAAGSFALELVQYVLAVGSSDATDLIANTGGGLIGIATVALLRRILGPAVERTITRVLLVGTCVVLVMTVLFLVSPMRFAPPQDRAADVQTSGPLESHE